MKCPLCKGTGRAPEPRNVEERRRIAVALREIGIPYRKIAKMIGYRSPNAVVWLVRSAKGGG